MATLLATARVGAIGSVASGSMARGLSLQQAFVLHVIAAETPIFAHVNQALTSGNCLPFWAPFIATLHDALLRLPRVERVFRFEPGRFVPNNYAAGTALGWPGFASASTSFAMVLPGQTSESAAVGAASDAGVVFCIKSRTGRSLSALSSGPASSEVLLLPGTQFKVMRSLACEKPPSGEDDINALLRQPTHEVTTEMLAGAAVVIVELEEVEEPPGAGSG